MSKKTLQKTLAILLYLPILIVINGLASRLLPFKELVFGGSSFAEFPFPMLELHWRLTEILCLGTILNMIEFAFFIFLLLKNKVKPLNGLILISIVNFMIVMFFRYLEIQRITFSLPSLFFKSCYSHHFN